MTVVRAALVVASACGRGASPVPATERAPQGAARDAGQVVAAPADGAIVDETAPAVRVWQAAEGRSLVGHTRASWPLDLPEMPWIAGSFANLALSTYDGARVTGSVDLYAAPGLDPRRCVIEVVWTGPAAAKATAKRGVQLRGAPAVEVIDEQTGTHAAWRFGAAIAGAPPAVRATAYAFCPNGVMFYSIEMVVAGPAMHDAYCADVRRDPSRRTRGTLVGRQTFDLAFSCGTLVRARGGDLVDDCRGDTLVSLADLGATAAVPPTGAPITDVELRAWFGGGAECARIQLDGRPAFPASAAAPYAAFVTRAGDRLLDAFSRDGIRQP